MTPVKAIQVSEGQVVELAPFPSHYFTQKTVHVWLPAHYSNDKKFAVLYMHDGQHLFDASITWNNQEWGVDEVASSLMASGEVKDFIVVGVFNGNESGQKSRHREYFPQKVFESLPEAKQQLLLGRSRDSGLVFSGTPRSDNYLKFLVEELKPYIDNTFSVKTDKQNTFVMGSSMGGLISLYAISEYPDVFGAAACLSTHWLGVLPEDKDWLPPYFFAYMQSHLPKPDENRLYFDLGTETLDQHYPPLQQKADEVLRTRGFDESNWVTKTFEGAAHDESSWQERLHIPLTFLLGKQ